MQTMEAPMSAIDKTLRVENIKVNTNIRKYFEPGQMKELAENIGKVGILEPLLVRENGEGYLLIAGERRLRAAKMAGVEEVPVRILDVDEKQAAEIQAFENLHRQDLTPIEEARAFKLLLEKGSHTVETLADRIDKSIRQVYRTMKLLDLPERVVEAIDAGTLTPAHGHQLLRATPKVQQELIGWLLPKKGYPPTSRELEYQIIEKVGKDLSRAPFPKDVAYAGQIACSACPFNSGNQSELFDGATKGTCTNPGCFSAKIEEELKEFQAKNAAKYDGMDYLGAGESPWDIRGKHKAFVQLSDWEHLKNSAVQKALKETPERFAWMLQTSKWHPSDRKAVLFAKSSGVLKSVMPQKASSSRNGSLGPSPKEEYVEKAISAELIKAAVEFAKSKFSRRHLEAIARYQLELLWNDDKILPLIGLEAKSSPAKWNEKELGQAVSLIAVLDNNEEVHEKTLKGVGVDIVKLKAAAKAAALKVWDLQEKAKKQKGKK